jgi:hypothetical protein
MWSSFKKLSVRGSTLDSGFNGGFSEVTVRHPNCKQETDSEIGPDFDQTHLEG